MNHRGNGSKLIELAFVLSLIAILVFLGLPKFVQGKDAAKEGEAKANLHTLQQAIERYATDNGEYPRYLLGGDVRGWEAWHIVWDAANNTEMADGRVASNDLVRDPLIEYGYLDSYPANPFTDDGHIRIGQTNVDGSEQPGRGDPRFGWAGNLMGEGLDDPNFFKGALNNSLFAWSSVETRRTLDHGEWMNVPDWFKNPETNMYYLFGGFRTPVGTGAGRPTSFWPGNFFYKAVPDVIMYNRNGFSMGRPNTGTLGGRRDRYILGVYGAQLAGGLDVIRLEGITPDGDSVSWRYAAPRTPDADMCGYEEADGSWGKPIGLPEVFGGGDERTGPWWYYNEGGRNEGDFIYGAPDGVPDGVILVLVDGGNTYQEVDGNE
jgi:type II secretory pathway pseudopilin PulG